MHLVINMYIKTIGQNSIDTNFIQDIRDIIWINKLGLALNKRQQNDSTGNPSSFCSIGASEVHF